MNTSVLCLNKNIVTAEDYYRAMLLKDFDKMASFYHKDVRFIGPREDLCGKDAVLAAAKGFAMVLRDIKIRSKCFSENQVMLAYDIFAGAATGAFRAAVLIDFTDGLIARIELFFDGSSFQE